MNYHPTPLPMDAAPQSGLSKQTETMPNEFFERYSPAGFRYALSMVQNRNDAEEIVQESFCRMIKSFENNGLAMKTEGHIKATFFTTIRNLCIDSHRQKKQVRKFQEEQNLRQPTAFSNDPPESSEKRLNQINYRVARTLETMPSEWADALKLKMNGELSYEQIANVMESTHGKVTHGQVRTWIYRARRQLESELKENELM